MPAQINDIGEAVVALTSVEPDRLVLLIVLAEIAVVGAALWIVYRMIKAIQANSDTLREKIEADVAQTARITEMSTSITELSTSIGRMIDHENKRFELTLEALNAVRQVESGVKQVGAQVKTIDTSLDDLRKFIAENGTRNTERVLESVNALFKRFDDAEDSARISMRQALEAGARILEAIDGAKGSIIQALMQAEDEEKKADDNRTDSSDDRTQSGRAGSLARNASTEGENQ